MKALVAEDDFTSRTLLQRLLSRWGFCDAAANGKEAVKAFRSALDEGQPYDLVCLDIMMPEMDGQAALKMIRKIEKGILVPDSDRVKIIMTTALSDQDNIVEAAKSQVDAYLIKPVSKKVLLDKVKEMGILD